MADSNKKSAEQLGLVGLIALCVSAMVGSGVFDLPKNMSMEAGVTAQLDYYWDWYLVYCRNVCYFE